MLFRSGTNELIQQGAKLVTNVDEVLEEILALQDKVKNTQKNLAPIEKLTLEEQKIWEILSETPQSIDNIINKSQIEPSIVTIKLLAMELKGLITIFPGHRYSRKIH